MTSSDLFTKGMDLNIIQVDTTNDRVTYRLGKEKQYKWSDPEESIRAETILRLAFEYQYSPLRMETEVQIPSRIPGNYADIVVFTDDKRRDPYITVEVKADITTESERNQFIEQLFGYANSLKSRYAVYYDGHTRNCYDVLKYGGLEREQNLVADIPRNYGNVPKYTYCKAGPIDLVVINSNELSRLFERCHNELWSGGRFDPTTAFDEMSKLMFAKLYDERRTMNGQAYDFQWGSNETDIMVAQRITKRYGEARHGDPGVFTDDIHAEPWKVAAVVKLLQRISLVKTDPDAKGRAFEQFLGEVFRGRLGQYFTRREIVDFLVTMLNPTQNDVILDPACGSGGFLVYSMKRVFQQIEQSYQGDDATIFRFKNQFANSHIYGIEINEKIARVAMMDMVINEDGHTNIENHSAFDNTFSNPNIRDNQFSLVLTNPPFGDHVKADARDKLGHAALSDFTLAGERKSVKSEVLFIERCVRFLDDGGRIGIVIPDGVLSNPSDKQVRTFIFQQFHILAIVTLPPFAFRKAGSGMRTSLLMARKWEAHENRDMDYEIFMAIAEHIGYDATARPDTNNLPSIAMHYENYTGTLDDKVIRIRRRDATGNLRLDPLYYYLERIINQAFNRIAHPTCTLQDIAGNTIQSGKSPSGGAKYSIGAVPILLVGNILADGSLALDDLYYVSDDFYEANEGKAAVYPLDILIAKDGATTGKVGIIPEDFPLEKCLINEHIFKVTISAKFPNDPEPSNSEDKEDLKRLNTYYVFFFLKTWLGQRQIQREISGGAQGGITRTFVGNIKIPVPPVEERRVFVTTALKEYGKYLELVDQTQRQRRQLDDSISARIQNWRSEEAGITEEEFEQALRRVIRRL